MAGWASGFQAGSALGRSLIDTYQQAREQRLIQEAQARRDQAPPLPFEMQEPEAAPAPVAPDQGLARVPMTPQQMERAARAMPTVEPMTQAEMGLVPAAVPQLNARMQYGDRAYAGTVAERAPGLYRRELADIVALRNPAEAERMRAAIEQGERTEEEYAYRKGRRGIQEERESVGLAGEKLRLKTAEGQAREAEANKKADELIANAIASGQEITQAQLGEFARQSGASPTYLTNAVLTQWGLTDKQVERESAKFLKDLTKASTRGTAGINEFLAKNFDPDPTDGIAPTLVQGRGGMQIMYGGRPLAGWGTYGDVNEFIADASGRIKGDPLAAGKYLLEKRVKEAQIGLYGAQRVRAEREPVGPANPYQQRIDAFRAATGRMPTEAEISAMVGASRPWVQQGARPVSMSEITNIAKDMVGKPVMTPDGRVRLDENNKPLMYTLRTAIQQVQEDIASGLYGMQPTGVAPQGGGLPDWGAGTPAPAPAPRGPVDLSPVGRVSVAGAPAAASAPGPQVIPGVGTVLSRTATGLNVDVGNGRTQFVPYAELQQRGIYQY